MNDNANRRCIDHLAFLDKSDRMAANQIETAFGIRSGAAGPLKSQFSHLLTVTPDEQATTLHDDTWRIELEQKYVAWARDLEFAGTDLRTILLMVVDGMSPYQVDILRRQKHGTAVGQLLDALSLWRRR